MNNEQLQSLLPWSQYAIEKCHNYSGVKYYRFISKVEQNIPVSFCNYGKKELIAKTPDYKALTFDLFFLKWYNELDMVRGFNGG